MMTSRRGQHYRGDVCTRGHVNPPRSKSGACKLCAREYVQRRTCPKGGAMLSIREAYDVINAVRFVLRFDELEPSR